MNEIIHDVAEVTDDHAVTFDLGFALLDEIPAPVAARALLAICDEHGIDWRADVTEEVACGVETLAANLGVLATTPLEDLIPEEVVDGRRSGIDTSPVKPNGNRGTISATEDEDGPDGNVCELLAAALTSAGAAKSLGAVIASLPAATATRALVAACEGLGVDWESWLGYDEAAGVRELLSEPESTRVATPYGDLVARTFDDSGTYMGIIVDLEKPDGTSGQVSITEAVAECALDYYPTPIHTFAWDGVEEDCVASTDLDPDGPEMGYPYRAVEPSELEGKEGLAQPKPRVGGPRL
jgi:hypothetical protein